MKIQFIVTGWHYNQKDTIKALAIHSKDVGSTEIQIGLLTDRITK